jgi:hypothetical protein
MGLATESAMVLQITLGFISNALWTPTRRSIPWWDQAHWWLGRLLSLFAIATLYLGFDEFNSVVSPDTSPIPVLLRVVFWLWIGVGLVVLVSGQFLYGQVHHGDFEEHQEPPEYPIERYEDIERRYSGVVMEYTSPPVAAHSFTDRDEHYYTFQESEDSKPMKKVN